MNNTYTPENNFEQSDSCCAPQTICISPASLNIPDEFIVGESKKWII